MCNFHLQMSALHDALEFARSGDTLIVWKLDRLARSMKQLIETIENLETRYIGFRSLTEALDATPAQGRLVFPDIPQMPGPLGVILCPPRRGGNRNSIATGPLAGKMTGHFGLQRGNSQTSSRQGAPLLSWPSASWPALPITRVRASVRSAGRPWQVAPDIASWSRRSNQRPRPLTRIMREGWRM
jgi:hypothetical protein